MDFKTRRIRKRPPAHPLRKLKTAYSWMQGQLEHLKPKRRSYAMGGVLVLLGAWIVWRVMTAAYGWISSFDPESLLFSAGTELRQDENGYTNLVLLGDGGHVRDGADLIDTIMAVSLDHKNNAVTLLSIPRDYYTRGVGIANGRINELYRNNKLIMPNGRAFELFQEAAGQLANLDIHYYLRVDFNAFVEVVDALDGIRVNVPDTIDDPFYPNPTDDGYEPFKLEAGLQNIDGETALKYVRSRKTTSDFDRAARQQLVLAALREKALEKEMLTKPAVLKKLYASLRKNLNTNLTIREMISLGRFAKNFNRDRLISRVLHDDPTRDGGFLYTPERELYEGQFVLVPGDNGEDIHRYSDLIFRKREAFFKPLPVEILNATKAGGLAGRTAGILERFGFTLGNIDNLNGSDGERIFADKTVIRYYDWEEKDGQPVPTHTALLEALQSFVKAEAVPADPTLAKGAAITVILGADYGQFLVD